ncbi:MAG TPA: hypothetical protein VGK43_02845, partial [Solirubrobacterales bacterium]
MTLIARTIFILLLVLAPAGKLFAQETPTAETEAEAETPAAAAETPAEENFEVRDQLTRLLKQHPDELWMILKLDPALLANDAFLSRYPEVQAFVARHPEILRNPRFYLAYFENPAVQYRSTLDGILEILAVMGGVGLTVVALGWLIRTLIEQKRWKQLSRTQNEVHNKLLDRFSTSEQLIEYIRTPAGG